MNSKLSEGFHGFLAEILTVTRDWKKDRRVTSAGKSVMTSPRPIAQKRLNII